MKQIFVHRGGKNMKKKIFSGVGTALVTPFLEDKIDYATLGMLIDGQIDAGVGALIIGGTTGEAATLSDKERYELYAFSRERIGGRCALVLGTGTNDTRVAIRHTHFAEELGCDGALLVTPYYNKGTERGVVAHYRKIAESTSLPLILYNVPGRTGVNMTRQMLESLSKVENIVAIKEASDSADKLAEVAAMRQDLALYAGNDSQLFTVLALGGEGVISVVSNIAPRRMNEIFSSFRKGDIAGARDAQLELLPLIRAMFCETNPSPIKYAMERLGLCSGELRLPLLEVSDDSKRKIDIELSRCNFLE
jgi:4-hydroxy-tetrahydrodipicolinate synthase